jgi:hypothetical protein
LPVQKPPVLQGYLSPVGLYGNHLITVWEDV